MSNDTINAENFSAAMETLDKNSAAFAKRRKMLDFLRRLNTDRPTRPEVKPLRGHTADIVMFDDAQDPLPLEPAKNGFTVEIAAPGDVELTRYDPATNRLRYQPRKGMTLAQVQAALSKTLKTLGVNVRVSIQTGVNRATRRKQMQANRNKR